MGILRLIMTIVGPAASAPRNVLPVLLNSGQANKSEGGLSNV